MVKSTTDNINYQPIYTRVNPFVFIRSLHSNSINNMKLVAALSFIIGTEGTIPLARMSRSPEQKTNNPITLELLLFYNTEFNGKKYEFYGCQCQLWREFYRLIIHNSKNSLISYIN